LNIHREVPNINDVGYHTFLNELTTDPVYMSSYYR
jgi:hypothetical protein